MGQYAHHVFVCTSGTARPSQGSEPVHAKLERRLNADPYHAPPGGGTDV